MKTLVQIYNDIKQNPQKPFLISQHGKISYGELLNRIQRFVGLFEHYQIKAQQRIIICSENDDFVICNVAAAFLHGVTSITLTAETSSSRLDSIIQKTKPAVIFIDEQLQAVFQLKGDYQIFTIAKQRESSSLLNRFKRQSKSGWLTALNDFEPVTPALPTETSWNCFLNFTSGTTGEAKGVQITYKNLLTHLQTLTNTFQYSSDSRILNNMILAHADGMIQGPILTLFNNCTLYRPYDMDVQHLEPLLNKVYQERVTHMITVPTILSFIDRFTQHNDYFQGEDFRHLISVAGMLDNLLWKRLEQRLSVRICNIYGLTETVAGGIFCGPMDSHFCHGSIGKPIDMEICIMDAHGQPCDADEKGELWLKGDNVFPGYYQNTQKTEESFSGDWFKTGDIATRNKHGFITICGRIKELIITGGFNVHPAEVNEALLRHPHIVEAATLGVADPDWQEIVVSAVVLSGAEKVEEKQIITHCRQWLESKKVPRKIYIVENLPKGDAGKVNIPKLQEQLAQLKNNHSQSTKILNEESLLTLASEVFQVDRATLSIQSKVGETPGWDSLGHLSLIVSIEEMIGQTLSTQQIMSIQSLADVLDLVHE